MSAAAIRPWLSIVGVGEDGLDGLSPAASRVLAQASFVIGGARHLALLQPIAGTAVAWPSPFERGIEIVKARRGSPTCVVASGDPFLYGVGATLASHIPPEEMICFPAPSSLSLAAARLGWPLQDCEVVSLHGRPLERIVPHLRPNARVLALSWDGATPEKLAHLLVTRKFEKSRLVVMTALGGPRESVYDTRARDFEPKSVDPLNVVAIEVEDAPNSGLYLPLTSGLPDDWFEHDGQITKRAIRAITLSALAPWPGAILWDVGAGSGAIGIEWMLAHPRNRAFSIETNLDRAARIRRNAASLGTPNLTVVEGDAREVMKNLPSPDAIFVGGGGVTLIDAAWRLLPSKRRFVANAVTMETQAALAERQKALGGELISIAVSYPESVGSYQSWRPATPIVQWATLKQ
jgi:precorrin-6B C5,15-methyltransferase / cobalt-precorrin-6B C5,C15-methyltransferase